MKKLLLTLGLATFMLSAKAQIIITGTMFDPQGSDAPSENSITSGHTHKGGYEYMQFMATEDINFATTPFSVVRCINTGSTTGAEPDGWAATGLARTFKFNLTSGTVNKGEFFYVGGPEKTAGGYLDDGTTYYPVLDLSASKWIRTIAYSNGTITSVGDDGIGIGNTGLVPNSVAGSAANPIGIAVFAGTSINANSVPIDAIFMAYTASLTAGSTNAVYKDNGDATFNGYKVPTTDLYTAGYFGTTNNKMAILFQPTTNVGYFLKLSGNFNPVTDTWITPRTGSYVQLVPPASYGTVAERSSFATLAMLEGSAAGYNGTGTNPFTLPVSLTTFTAKANKTGSVNLVWGTASELNNAYFEVTRSSDGVNFSTIGKVTGIGTSNTLQNYNYTDTKPKAGANYYRLKQVDNDGKFAFSQVVSATVGLGNGNLTVSVAANRNAVKVNYTAVAAGNASVSIYNISGVKIATVNKAVEVGQNQIDLPVALSSALHILKVSQAGLTSSIKF